MSGPLTSTYVFSDDESKHYYINYQDNINRWINDKPTCGDGYGHIQGAVTSTKINHGPVRALIGNSYHTLQVINNDGTSICDVEIDHLNVSINRIKHITGIGIYYNALQLSICDIDYLNRKSEFNKLFSTSDIDFTAGHGTVVNLYFSVLETIPINSTTIKVNSVSGLSPGDEILLWQIQGQNQNYEYCIIKSIIGNVIEVLTPISFTYYVESHTTTTYDSAYDGIITDYYFSKVQIVRIPHYKNVTIPSGCSIVAKPWDGSTGGILIFRCSQKLINYGTITSVGSGFRDTSYAISNSLTSQSSESYRGYRKMNYSYAYSAKNNKSFFNGGGPSCYLYYSGGYKITMCRGGGGGGGSMTSGYSGIGCTPGVGGSSYGVSTFNKLPIGGGGGCCLDSLAGRPGSGTIIFSSPLIYNYGTIDSSGLSSLGPVYFEPNYLSGDTLPMYGGGGGSGFINIIGFLVLNYGTIKTETTLNNNTTYSVGGGGLLKIDCKEFNNLSSILNSRSVYYEPTLTNNLFKNIKYQNDVGYECRSTDLSNFDISQFGYINNIILDVKNDPQSTSYTVKILLSFDNRVTWVYYNGEEWIPCDLSNISTFGISYIYLNSLKSVDFFRKNGFYRGRKTLDWAIYIKGTENYSPRLYKLTVNGYSHKCHLYNVEVPRSINKINNNNIIKVFGIQL